ncbi:MAG: hypothetical protein WBA23_12450, partial [Tunicatimonas sp.]|uniref:hypothetical protein n=1 Tax=Tunicatimonas sp. TaxID=1940096 RepID=UPI003C749D71
MMTVYHLQYDLYRQGVLLSGLDLEPEHYTPVALVLTNHIGTAYGLTQHPEPRGSWPDYPEVSPLLTQPIRSSMVGDLLLNEVNELYIVLGTGYKRVRWGNQGIIPYLDAHDELSDNFLYKDLD